MKRTLGVMSAASACTVSTTSAAEAPRASITLASGSTLPR